MKQDVETLREMNRLRQDDVRENRAINKNKAMTIKAHIIQKQLMMWFGRVLSVVDLRSLIDSKIPKRFGLIFMSDIRYLILIMT